MLMFCSMQNHQINIWQQKSYRLGGGKGFDRLEKPLRIQLKDETRSDHDRLDAQLSSVDLSGRSGLGVFLLMQAGALSVLEPMMADPLYPPPPSQLALVKADLKTLSLAAEPFSPSCGTAGLHPVGLIYVVAGSHFGNNMLRRNWAQATDPQVLLAGKFLNSVAMKEYWPHFADYLKQSAFGANERKHIIDSAKACFRIFEEAYGFAVKSASHDEF